jgi:hypothetical protein
MSARIVKLNASTHQAAQELLPWFVTDRLLPEEKAMVQEHLQCCAICQADVDFQRQLTELTLPTQSTADVDAAFAKLRPKLTARPRATPTVPLASFVRRIWAEFAGSWMRWALGAQLATIGALCIMLLQPDHDAAYRGLGQSGNHAGNIVVTFKPQTSEQELRRILHAASARVVDGPTVTDAYLLNVEEDHREHALAQLRSEPAVVLAESLESGSKR